MSGTFWFSKDRFFCPAGWVWRTIVEYLRKEGADYPEILEVMSDLVTEETEHFDFENASVNQLEVLGRALERIHNELRTKGPIDWSDEKLFPGFMCQLEKLIKLLDSNPNS